MKQGGFDYEQMAQANARQFDYEANNIREGFQSKLTRAKEDVYDLKQQRDRLLEELETVRGKNKELAEEVTALALQ